MALPVRGFRTAISVFEGAGLAADSIRAFTAQNDLLTVSMRSIAALELSVPKVAFGAGLAADSIRAFTAQNDVLTEWTRSITALDLSVPKVDFGAGLAADSIRTFTAQNDLLTESMRSIAALELSMPKTHFSAVTPRFRERGYFDEVVDVPRYDPPKARSPGALQTRIARLLSNFGGPELVEMWDGAWAALEREEPDSVRHVLASLRALVDNVLWDLAPVEAVLSWAGPGDTLANRGRPTRRARMLYARVTQRGGLGQTDQVVVTAALRDYSDLHRLHAARVGIPRVEVRSLVERVGHFLEWLLDSTGSGPH
jgi:hypothetical protein